MIFNYSYHPATFIIYTREYQQTPLKGPQIQPENPPSRSDHRSFICGHLWIL